MDLSHGAARLWLRDPARELVLHLLGAFWRPLGRARDCSGKRSAIIQRRDLTADQISRLNGLALLLGWAFVALSAVLAWPVAVFFGEAAVRWIILASSITFLMTALQIVPRALLTRDLDFRRLAWADGAEALVAAGATLAFAAVGLRYWALVLGPLA